MNAIAKLPPTARERGKIAPAKLAHVVLKTAPERVEILSRWYKTVLEGEAMFENEGLAFITYDADKACRAPAASPSRGQRRPTRRRRADRAT
jgi:hypothetical protein